MEVDRSQQYIINVYNSDEPFLKGMLLSELLHTLQVLIFLPCSLYCCKS